MFSITSPIEAPQLIYSVSFAKLLTAAQVPASKVGQIPTATSLCKGRHRRVMKWWFWSNLIPLIVSNCQPVHCSSAWLCRERSADVPWKSGGQCSPRWVKNLLVSKALLLGQLSVTIDCLLSSHSSWWRKEGPFTSTGRCPTKQSSGIWRSLPEVPSQRQGPWRRPLRSMCHWKWLWAVFPFFLLAHFHFSHPGLGFYSQCFYLMQCFHSQREE